MPWSSMEQNRNIRDRLKSYGVYAVRGPRSVPPALHDELEVMSS